MHRAQRRACAPSATANHLVPRGDSVVAPYGKRDHATPTYHHCCDCCCPRRDHRGFTIASASRSSSSSPAASTSAGGSMTIAGDPASAATVQTAAARVQGTTEMILGDAHGLPLYVYKPDTTTTSHVTGQLAALWPPLVAGCPDCWWCHLPTHLGSDHQRRASGLQRPLSLHVRRGQSRTRHRQGVQNFLVATPAWPPAPRTPVTAAP
jgi:hypothetical protein